MARVIIIPGTRAITDTTTGRITMEIVARHAVIITTIIIMVTEAMATGAAGPGIAAITGR